MGRLDKDADGWFVDPDLRRRQYRAVSQGMKRWSEDATELGKGQGLGRTPEAGSLSLILDILASTEKEMNLIQKEIVTLRNSVSLLQKKRNPKGCY